MGVIPNVEVSDTRLDGDAQAIDEHLIFGHIVEEGKWMQTMYLMHTPRGEMKTSPMPVPFFISEPSKYIVQYSWSRTVGGIWTSVHSVMKSTITWDLMVVRGAYEMP